MRSGPLDSATPNRTSCSACTRTALSSTRKSERRSHLQMCAGSVPGCGRRWGGGAWDKIGELEKRHSSEVYESDKGSWDPLDPTWLRQGVCFSKCMCVFVCVCVCVSMSESFFTVQSSSCISQGMNLSSWFNTVISLLLPQVGGEDALSTGAAPFPAGLTDLPALHRFQWVQNFTTSWQLSDALKQAGGALRIECLFCAYSQATTRRQSWCSSGTLEPATLLYWPDGSHWPSLKWPEQSTSTRATRTTQYPALVSALFQQNQHERGNPNQGRMGVQTLVHV